MTKPPTQRDLQAESRRLQLLDIALNLFSERGVENVSIKDIAAEAKVAQGLLYHYFPSKDDLLAAVFQRHNPMSEFEIILHDLSDLPAHEGLMLFAQRLAQLLPEKRRAIRLLVREMLSPRSTVVTQVVALRRDAIALLTDYLQQRIAAGELRPHLPFVPIHMLVSSLLILLLLDQPLEPFVTQFADTILNGILSPKSEQ
jgi:AcrR family transcriptional regulator